jgi:hypothetical protein
VKCLRDKERNLGSVLKGREGRRTDGYRNDGGVKREPGSLM